MLWDLNDGKHLYTLDHMDTINGLCFSPNRSGLPVIILFSVHAANVTVMLLLASVSVTQ